MKENNFIIWFTLLISLIIVGCDPEDAVNEYFAKQGLNRLAILRTDIEPGALILVGKQGAIYADNMRDYTKDDTRSEYSPEIDHDMSQYRAVLASYHGERGVKAEAAIGFLSNILNVNLQTDLKLSGDVRIDMVDAQVRRLKAPAIQDFLNAEGSGNFRQTVLNELKRNRKAYIAYEVYLTDRLRIVELGDVDIAPKLDVGSVAVPAASQRAGFKIWKRSSREIEVVGDTLYVFAVKTAELDFGLGRESVELKIASQLDSNDFGIKSVEDPYSAPISGNYRPIVLLSKD